MSNYVEKNLANDEKIICKAKINKLAIIAPLTVVAVMIALIFLAKFLLEEYLFSQLFWKDVSGAVDIVLKVIVYFVPIFIAFVFATKALWILLFDVAVTNKRLIGKEGIISTSTIDIPLNQISSGSINCGLFGRIFKYSEIEITSTGMKIIQGTSRGVVLLAISNAREFLNALNSAIDEQKKIDKQVQLEELAKMMENK